MKSMCVVAALIALLFQAPAEREPLGQVFSMAKLLAKNRASGRAYTGFLDVPALSCGIYRLEAGAKDGQSPHKRDEIYYVESGKAKIRIGKAVHACAKGSVIYVPAHVEHRFFDIEEDLELLVLFSTGPTKQARKSLPAKVPADLDRWRSEKIQLPPEFAPKLPSGLEELRFAPGMFDARAEDYWSYVFVLRLDDRVRGRAALLELLERYYVGLIESVAKGRGLELDRPAAKIELEAVTETRYVAKVDLIDAFVTGKPVVVNMELELVANGKGMQVLVAASPKARSHAIWTELRGVLGTLRSDP